MNRAQFQRLADLRALEARRLLDGRMYDGAYYLAGYAVECGLKACIAKLVRRHEFPGRDFVRNSYTHDFKQLIRTAELGGALQSDCGQDPRLAENWLIVGEWREDSRYLRRTRAQAIELIAAILEDSHGVLPWIKRYW